MREMVLLGAGASEKAGVPTAYEMTPKLLKLFDQAWGEDRFSWVLHCVVGGLLFQQGIKGRNPFDGINVEDVFNAIDLLSRRDEADVAAFVSSWHPVAAELDTVPMTHLTRYARVLREATIRSVADELDATLERAFASWDRKITGAAETAAGRAGSKYSVGGAISEAIHEGLNGLRSGTWAIDDNFEAAFREASSPETRRGRGWVFTETTKRMTAKLVEIVWIQDVTKVTYLKPLLNHSQNDGLTIATLNYDNAIELAAAEAGTPVTTGIGDWLETGRFPRTPGRGVLLLKLHGSIDWEAKEEPGGRGGPFPFLAVEKVSPTTMKQRGFRPAVVFGYRNKLTTKGPFLELLRAFERELKKTDRLTTIGYSFRDEHIDEFIAQWLNTKPQAKLRVIDIRHPERSEVRFARALKMRLQDRLEVIEAPASEGIAQCFGSPEVPAHETQV